jgi:hypothetical protein
MQDAYFGWLAWTLLGIVVVLGVACALTKSRALGAATAILGADGFVLTVFALKGELTWSQYWDGHANLRLGGYLAFVGFLLASAAGGLSARRRD